MIKRNLKNIGLALLLLFCCSFVRGQGKIHKVSQDHFTIEIDRSTSTPITILQVTDLHLGSPHEGKWKRDGNLSKNKKIG